MIYEKLGNISKITSGGTPSRNKPEYFANGEIPWVKTGDLGKKYVTEPVERISQLGLENSSAKIFPVDTVLVAMYGATIGSCSILSFEASTNQACAAFLPNSKLNSEYLYYFLRSIKHQLVSMGKGGGQPNISAGLLKNIEIPFPPINDQIRIAHLLGKVEGLITQRKQHIEQLDDLLKSVFSEMFGDPVRNEKKWDIQPCDKVVLNISSGTSYGGEDRLFENDEEVGVLKISAVTKGTFDPTEFKVVNQSQIKKSLRFVRRGDFLFSRANTIDLVAACCVVMQDYERLFLPDKLWVLTLNKNLIDPQFFNYLLKNERYRNIVRNLASGGHDSMLNISMKKFMTLAVPCPPIELQNKFSVIVEKIDRLKNHHQKSLTDLYSLYETLSQKAFKGELDLSRVLPPKLSEKEISSTKNYSVQKGISRSTEKAIKELNAFNQSHNSVLKAIQNASAVTRFDSPAIQAMRDLAEQASLWRTPLDELKNMAAIARATDALAISANISNLTMEASTISKAAKLAQNIANSLPKIDMDWLKDQRSAIEDAMKPFSQMRDTMATLVWPENVSRSIMESASVMEQMRTVLPTDINLMRLPPTSSISISDIEEVEEPMYIFTRYDILETLKQEVAPLSFEDLLTKLASLGDITFEGYERIKKLIFELISKGDMLQSYNDEKNNVQLTVTA